MLAAIERQRPSVIIVPDLPTAFRDARDCLSFVQVWSARGIGLHVVDLFGGPVQSESTDALLFQILARRLLAPAYPNRQAA